MLQYKKHGQSGKMIIQAKKIKTRILQTSVIHLLPKKKQALPAPRILKSYRYLNGYEVCQDGKKGNDQPEIFIHIREAKTKTKANIIKLIMETF